MPAAESFPEFWLYYVRQHSRPGSRWLHFLGTTAAFAVLAVCAALWWWPAAIIAPAVGCGLAFLSHAIIEHNRPESFQRPVWSLLCDLKMWWLMLAGRMEREWPAQN